MWRVFYTPVRNDNVHNHKLFWKFELIEKNNWIYYDKLFSVYFVDISNRCFIYTEKYFTLTGPKACHWNVTSEHLFAWSLHSRFPPFLPRLNIDQTSLKEHFISQIEHADKLYQK